MFSCKLANWFRHTPPSLLAMLLILGLCAPGSTRLLGQDQAPSSTSQQNPNTQPPPPEAGGPGGDVGPYAVPRKKDEPPPPPLPEKPKKIEGMPDYSIRVDVPLVNVDVSVVTKEGMFLPGLQKGNFKIFEDGAPQEIVNFNRSEAPITAVLLVEFASTNYYFLYDALNASYAFASGLKKDDWIAVAYYDMRPHILVDFTQDKRAVLGALNRLQMPGFSETNLFDALYDTLDRLDRIEGRKYIVLVSSGVDTFSKLNLDQILKKIKATKNVTIYAMSIGRAEREWFDAHGATLPHGVAPVSYMDYLQADNEMNTFARLTGGRAFFPRFEAEIPQDFQAISADIRNQYNLTYHPTNPKLDGSYRKLKVEVVGPDGSPLKVKDQKGKDVKYQVIAREGYTAKHEVE